MMLSPAQATACLVHACQQEDDEDGDNVGTALSILLDMSFNGTLLPQAINSAHDGWTPLLAASRHGVAQLISGLVRFVYWNSL